MKKIKLTKGQHAIVDDEDYLILNRFNWCVHNVRGYCFAVRTINRKQLQMEEFIMPKKYNGTQLSHINKNTLDNRKSNLIEVSHTLLEHRAKKQEGATSIYKGVSYYKWGKHYKWVASISKNKKLYRLGAFDNEVKAALAFNKKARELYGSFAYQNEF